MSLTNNILLRDILINRLQLVSGICNYILAHYFLDTPYNLIKTRSCNKTNIFWFKLQRYEVAHDFGKVYRFSLHKHPKIS